MDTKHSASMRATDAWWTFCAGSFSCFMAGAHYTFGAWSPALRDAFGYSQTQIGNLALAKDTGIFISMDAGLISGRCGPYMTLIIGCLGVCLGSGAIWSALKADKEISFVFMLFIFWVFGHGLGFLDNAGISTSIRNFPLRKGTAVGLMKAFEGISTAVFGTVYYTLYSGDDLSSYPLVLAISSIVVGVICAPIMFWTHRPIEEKDSIVAKKFFVLTVGLLIYIVFCAVVNFLKAYNVVVLIIAIGFLVGLFALAYPVASAQHGSVVSKSTFITSQPVDAARPNFTVGQMLMKIDFYMIFFVLLVAQGVGTMFANNLAQINKAAMNDVHASAGVLAAIFSVFNCSGRIIYGFGSEALRRNICRPWFLCVTCAIMTVSMFLLHAGKSILLPVTALMGLALGGTFAVQAVIMEELFGPKDLPLKYSCCYTCAFLGSLVFTALLSSHVYDAAAARQHRKECLGNECFGPTFTICGVCSLLAFFCSIALALRSRPTYQLVNDALDQPTEMLTM